MKVRKSFPSHPLSKTRGFTMLEMLIALSIAVGVIITGVVVYQTVAGGGTSKGRYVSLSPGEETLEKLYGSSDEGTLDVPVAPNTESRVRADLLKDRFWDDLSYANAVFCLGRGDGSINTHHPTEISVDTNFRGQSVDSSPAFLAVLEAGIPETVGVFSASRGAMQTSNLSIFILQPSADLSVLSVRAIYELDLISSLSPSGTYVSARRYEGETLTDFYDVFFPAEASGEAFKPIAVAFERKARLAVSEGASLDRLKVAEERPFYFVWWPDPNARTLGAGSAESVDANSPRASYPGMGGRTSLFFVVPMFPAL